MFLAERIKKILVTSALAVSMVVGCGKDGSDDRAFSAGVAESRMPVPVGIPTTGYRRLLAEGPEGPYNDLMPGTEKVHGHPSIKAMVLRGSDGLETVIARLGLIGIPPGMRSELVDILKDRIDRDLDDELILTATHTHAGPGRIVRGNFNALIADKFFPEFYKLLLDKTADVIEDAYADVSPAELGHKQVLVPDAHEDRRCEDMEDYQNDSMPVIAIRKGGDVKGMLVSYAVHSTVFRFEDFTLSSDIAGAIEEQAGNMVPGDIPVIFLNSWAGDMWYGDPDKPDIQTSPRPGSHGTLEYLGMIVADGVKEALDGMEWDDDPKIEARTFRYPLNRDIMSYSADEFQYDNGAVYCSLSAETCDSLMHLDGLDERCIPFSRLEPAADRAPVTVGRLGGTYFVTWPGESVTRLAESVMEAIRAEHGIDKVMFIGYAGSYLGYQLHEEDWWHGGYEASGSIWGPKQGDYMAEQAIEAFSSFMQDRSPRFDRMPSQQVPPMVVGEITPDIAIEPGTIVSPPGQSYSQLDEVVISVNGFDPWYGPPRVVLQKITDEGYVDMRYNGKAIDSDSMRFTSSLSVNPPYRNTDENARRYLWTFRMPLSRYSDSIEPAAYRFRIELGGPAPQSITTSEFDVEAE